MKALLIVLLTLIVSQQAMAEVRYITGGIGAEEREQIRNAGKEYNFQLKAAYHTGHYLADVKVMIEDESGQLVLDALTEGPFFYAQLEPGKYNVKAAFEGVEQSQKISIPANMTGQRQVIFRFKAERNPEE